MSIFLKIILDIDGEDLNPIGMNVFSTPSNSAVRVTLAMNASNKDCFSFTKNSSEKYTEKVSRTIFTSMQDDNI